MNFQRWMQEVDEICLSTYLTSIYELPDLDFILAYESEQTPREFIKETIPNLDSLSDLIRLKTSTV